MKTQKVYQDLINHMNLKDLKKQYNSITPDSELSKEARVSLMQSFKDTCPQTKVSFIDDVIRLMANSIRPAMVTVSTVLVVGFLTFGLYVSSANAMPGDFLYPVKISFEKARMQIAFKKSSQNALRAEVLNERLTEAELLAKRLNENGTSFNTEFNILAKNFVNELNALKKDIKKDMRKRENEIKNNKESNIMVAETENSEDNNIEGSNTPFPDEKLLSDLEQDNEPVKDGREIHPFNNTNLIEFQNIVSEIKESLRKEDIQAALNQIEKAKDMVSLEGQNDENETSNIIEENEDQNKDTNNTEENDSKENLENEEKIDENIIEDNEDNKEGSKTDLLKDENLNMDEITIEDQEDINQKDLENEDTNTDVINDSFESGTASLGTIPEKQKEVKKDKDFQTIPLEKNVEFKTDGMILNPEIE